MLKILKKFTAAARSYVDPLAESKPKIEWVKWVHSPSLVAFAAGKSLRLGGKMSRVSGQFFIKTKEGPVYQSYVDNGKWEWSVAGAHSKEFGSVYLDNIIENAMARGLRLQPAANEIFNSLMGHSGPRWWIMWNGSDEQFARLDDDYPSPPTGFNDTHSPEDFAESAPKFKAYLERKGYGPFWFDKGYDDSKVEKKQKPASKSSDPVVVGPRAFY